MPEDVSALQAPVTVKGRGLDAQSQADGGDGPFAPIYALIQAGEGGAARQELNRLLRGEARRISRHRTIGIYKAAAEPAPAEKREALRLLLVLAPLVAGPEALAGSLQALCAQLPELGQSPEALLLQSELAWQRGDRPAAARLLDAAEIAGSQSPHWQFAPFHKGLPHLRKGLLALLEGEDQVALPALTQAAEVLTEPALRLQAAYGLRLLRALPAEQSEQLAKYFGQLPLLGERSPDTATLADSLHRRGGSELERLLLLARLGELAPQTRIELLSPLVGRQRPPAWIYALGLARLELGETVQALAIWAELNALPPLPARLLRLQAVRLRELGQRAEARRCLEAALLAHPQSLALQDELRTLLLEAYAGLDQLIRLPETLDWANGGDLALKLGLESFADSEGVLLHFPGGWEPPVLQQALGWARTLPPAAVPPLWCGELPDSWRALPAVRVLPWRQLNPRSLPGEAVEIQPVPAAMHQGPVYFLASDPRSGQVWIETDPASLRRWLRAARRDPLPAWPVSAAQLAPRPEASLAALLSAWQPLDAELKGLFNEVLVAETADQIRQAADGIGSDWVFLLGPEIGLAAAHLWYLKTLVRELPAEIRALALGAAQPEAPQSLWPSICLLRRDALAGCQRGSFRPLLSGAGQRAADAAILYLPEIPLRVTALRPENPLDRAWQAYVAGQFGKAFDYCDEAEAAWPGSRSLQASCAGLRAACHGAQRAWRNVLELAAPETPRGFYWQGRALSALGRKADARQACDRAIAAQDRLQPAVLDLLPGIARLRELCAAEPL